MKLRDKIRVLTEYYSTNRGVGHTEAMLHGAIHTKNAIVIANTYSQAQHLKPRIHDRRIVPLDSLDSLLGKGHPILLDNSAVYTLLNEAQKEIARLDKLVNKLVHQARTQAKFLENMADNAAEEHAL